MAVYRSVAGKPALEYPKLHSVSNTEKHCDTFVLFYVFYLLSQLGTGPTMQETYSSNNHQIGGIIKDLMGSISTPIRVLGVAPNAFLDTAGYMGSIKSLVMKIEESVTKCH